VAKNYISCICQLNEYSAAFAENTRIILGKTAYSMRGLNDFTREFTDDQESVHLLTFTIERSAPLPQDSLEKQCADYESFRWDIGITGARSMTAGGTQKLSVKSSRMGETVLTSEEHPISYLYSSSDANIVTVDSEGNVSAIVPGSAVITVKLAQNPEISQTMALSVTAAEIGESVGFTTTLPELLGEYETVLIRAARFLDGAEQSGEVAFTFSGPPARCYGIENVEENAYRVTCYGASGTELTVTISDGNGHEKSESIRLTAGTTDNTDTYQFAAVTGIAVVGTGF
jgi:hypothetical protein